MIDYSDLTDDELQAEYNITQLELDHVNNQIKDIKTELHKLEKQWKAKRLHWAKQRDPLVRQYDAVRAEQHKRKEQRQMAQQKVDDAQAWTDPRRVIK